MPSKFAVNTGFIEENLQKARKLYYPDIAVQCLGHATVFPIWILKLGWDCLYYVNTAFSQNVSLMLLNQQKVRNS